MTQHHPADETTLREKLDQVIRLLPAEQVSLAQILDLIGREGLLLFCVFLTLPFMVPVSIPGVSTVFGAVILLIGVSVLMDRTPWLPDRFMRKEFPAGTLRAALGKGLGWVQRLERISRRRWLGLTHGPVMHGINGLMIVLGAVLLMAPFGLIPFSNTLPGLAVLFLAIGILQRDGVCILLGYVTNALTIVYFAVLILGGGLALRELWHVVLRGFGGGC
jgi:hypothetical protein